MGQEDRDAWFAEWFDEDYASLYAHRDEAEAERAVTTALQRIPELTQGPVLDLACGEGRHLKHLRRFNPEAFGLDLSAPLLARAPASLRPWLLRADMRALPIRPHRLTGITLWFTPFGYFSDAENAALLETLGSRLRPGGFLLLDLFNVPRLIRTLVPEETLEHPDLRVHIQRSLESDCVIKRMNILRRSDGRRRDVLERVRLYAPDDVDRLAHPAGLKRWDTWGDYEGNPFDSEHSPRWIGIYRAQT